MKKSNRISNWMSFGHLLARIRYITEIILSIDLSFQSIFLFVMGFCFSEWNLRVWVGFCIYIPNRFFIFLWIPSTNHLPSAFRDVRAVYLSIFFWLTLETVRIIKKFRESKAVFVENLKIQHLKRKKTTNNTHHSKNCDETRKIFVCVIFFGPPDALSYRKTFNDAFNLHTNI